MKGSRIVARPGVARAGAAGADEQFPLLLLYVEENGRKSEFPQRVVFADKGRGKHISLGAAAIISEWPAQLTSCWVTSVCIGIVFMCFTTVLLVSSLSPVAMVLHPKCIRDVTALPSNKTVYFFKYNDHWSYKQLEIVRYTVETFPDYQIKCIMMDSSASHFTKKNIKPVNYNEPKTFTPYITFPDFSNTFFKKLNKILMYSTANNSAEIKVNGTATPTNSSSTEPLKREKRMFPFFSSIPTTLEDILASNINIQEERILFKDYFHDGPLEHFWSDMNMRMKLFSARVLALWQHGGISFVLPHNELALTDMFRMFEKNVASRQSNGATNTTGTTTESPELAVTQEKDKLNVHEMKALITTTLSWFENLVEDKVSIDVHGSHMATKIPCHAFFGETIIKLQKGGANETVSNLIHQMLDTFCTRGAVTSEYCHKKK